MYLDNSASKSEETQHLPADGRLFLPLHHLEVFPPRFKPHALNFDDESTKGRKAPDGKSLDMLWLGQEWASI
jgi:hypothetical protein